MNVGKRKAVDAFQTQLDAVKKARTAPERRAKTQTSPAISKPTTSSTAQSSSTSMSATPPNPTPKSDPQPALDLPKRTTAKTPSPTLPTTNPSSSNLFTGTTIYINGSTLPQISDHKLKALLAAHGATIAITMARKTVSHIIIGQPGTTGQGAGGGLAGGKLQSEIERGGWKGFRVVGVDW
jgi:hypothetical protein